MSKEVEHLFLSYFYSTIALESHHDHHPTLKGCDIMMLNIEKTSQDQPLLQTSRLLITKENSSTYTHHDLLFKQLIQTFFEEFMEAFFPDLHRDIDFKSIKFLSEELFTDVYDGDKRVLDIVVEVKWKKTNTIIIVHVEPQSYQQKDFHQRMFHYFSLLYHKLRKPIIPIAVFSYDEPWDVDEFQMTIGDLDILKFKYLTLHLRNINWRHFIHKANPVSAALLSKMGYTRRDRVKVKIEFFRILTSLKIDLEKRDILVGFFEKYLQLSKEIGRAHV